MYSMQHIYEDGIHCILQKISATFAVYSDHWLTNELQLKKELITYPKLCNHYLQAIGKLVFSMHESEYSQKTRIWKFPAVTNIVNVIYIHIYWYIYYIKTIWNFIKCNSYYTEENYMLLGPIGIFPV